MLSAAGWVGFGRAAQVVAPFIRATPTRRPMAGRVLRIVLRLLCKDAFLSSFFFGAEVPQGRESVKEVWSTM